MICINIFYVTALMHLHDQTFWVAGRWFAQQSKEMRDDVLTHYGNLPEPEVNYYQLPNGPTWLWWLLIILPLQPCHQVNTNQTTGNVQAKFYFQCYFSTDTSVGYDLSETEVKSVGKSTESGRSPRPKLNRM